MTRQTDTSSAKIPTAQYESSPKVDAEEREKTPHKERLAMAFEELLGDDETTDESASDMILAIRQWRDVTSSRSLES